ncbi:DUF6056 family protein [Francisella salina]|nr:DUF6056 family protein [Francisella salina]
MFSTKSNLRYQIFIYVLIFAYFLVLNLCQPLMMDDLWRSNINALYNGTVFAHLKSDYLYWTGRVSAQLPVYILFNKSYTSLIYVVDMLNALALTVLVVYLYKLIFRDQVSILSRKFVIYACLFMGYFIENTFLGNAMWKTIGIQYLWGISLLVWGFYFLFVENKHSKVLSIILGIFLGLYNEAFFMVIFTICFYYIIHQIVKKDKLNRNTLYFLIPFIIAGIVMMAAPGNFARTNGMLEGQSLLGYIFHNLLDITMKFFSKFELSLPFILSIFMVFAFEKDIKTKIITSLCLVSVSLTTFLIMFGIAVRVEMIYMLIYFYIICKYLFRSGFSYLFDKLYLLFAVALLFFAGKFFYAYLQLGYYNHLRMSEVKHYQQLHEKNIFLPSLPLMKNSGVIYFELMPYSDDQEYIKRVGWHTQLFAEYYGFDSVFAK